MKNKKTTNQEPEFGPVQSGKPSLLHSSAVHAALLVLVALVVYSNTFQVPFILDDEGSIQVNSAVHGLARFFDGGYNFLPNRVVGYLTFAINYQLGELNVVGYHIFNLAIHIINALLVYCLVCAIPKTPCLKNTFSKTQTRLFGLVVALLFVSHPIQTQAITYIVQRLTSLTTMFYLTALIGYIRWRFVRKEAASFLNGVTSPWYALSLVAAVLAMKTKEIAFTLPIIILLMECSFFGWPGRKLLAQMTPLLLTITIIPCTVLSIFSPSIQPGGTLLSDLSSPAYNIVKITRWEYLCTQFSVIITYLRLLILPVNQNLDYDYAINHSLLEPKTFLSLLALLGILSLAVYLFINGKRHISHGALEERRISTSCLPRLASFGIFWFFITLSVESGIIVLSDVIFEHRLYLPSIGFFITLASFGALAYTRLEGKVREIRKLSVICLAFIVLILSVATYARNSIWKDWITLWSDTVLKSPNKDRAHNILGIGYFYTKRYDEALREFKEAVRIDQTYIEPYYNMGLIYKARKQHAEAIDIYLKILSICAFDAKSFAETYNEIGINYSELKEYPKAIKAFAESVKCMPESVEFRNNYAFSLSMNGNLDEAIAEYEKVIALDPANRYARAAITEIRSWRAEKRDAK